MGWLKKKHDPISGRARALNAKISRLEQQIHQLDARLTQGETPSGPRIRPAARPHGVAPEPVRDASKLPHEPIFEDMTAQRQRLDNLDSPATPDHFNEFGVRKYDLPALLDRIRAYFQGPPASNPKLVSYLAAGSIHGLRPMRYEKRIARNRFLLFAVCLLGLLVGIITWLLKH